MVVLGSQLRAQLEQGSSISLPSGKTEERDHTASKLAFASSLLESLQDKQNGFLCLQVRSRRVLMTFFFSIFTPGLSLQWSQYRLCLARRAQALELLDRTNGPWDNAHCTPW